MQDEKIAKEAACVTLAIEDYNRMIETLHWAYKFALDSVCLTRQEMGRLTDEEGRELGRRLATYWSVKPVQQTTPAKGSNEGE